MIKLILAISLIIASQWVFGQVKDKKNREKIKSARIALITDRLGLTPEQAEKFWPIYNEFIDKRASVAGEFRKEKRLIDPETASEEEKKRYIAIDLEKKQRFLELEKKYSERILNVISSQQMISLRKAERDFRRMLLNRLQQRQQQRQKAEQLRERRGERFERRNN